MKLQLCLQMTVESSTSADLTTLFKSCVKTIRTRNKAMGVTLPQSKIFPSSPTSSSQFYSRARDVMSNITSHRNLLHDHRKKYLQHQDHSMSDYERSYMEKVQDGDLKYGFFFSFFHILTMAFDVWDDLPCG